MPKKMMKKPRAYTHMRERVKAEKERTKHHGKRRKRRATKVKMRHLHLK